MSICAETRDDSITHVHGYVGVCGHGIRIRVQRLWIRQSVCVGRSGEKKDKISDATQPSLHTPSSSASHMTGDGRK